MGYCRMRHSAGWRKRARNTLGTVGQAPAWRADTADTSRRRGVRRRDPAVGRQPDPRRWHTARSQGLIRQPDRLDASHATRSNVASRATKRPRAGRAMQLGWLRALVGTILYSTLGTVRFLWPKTPAHRPACRSVPLRRCLSQFTARVWSLRGGGRDTVGSLGGEPWLRSRPSGFLEDLGDQRFNFVVNAHPLGKLGAVNGHRSNKPNQLSVSVTDVSLAATSTRELRLLHVCKESAHGGDYALAVGKGSHMIVPCQPDESCVRHLFHNGVTACEFCIVVTFSHIEQAGHRHGRQFIPEVRPVIHTFITIEHRLIIQRPQTCFILRRDRAKQRSHQFNSGVRSFRAIPALNTFTSGRSCSDESVVSE